MLTYQFVVPMPDTRWDEPEDQWHWSVSTELLKKSLLDKFGGYTVIRSEGHWLDQNRTDVEEDGHIYQVSTDKPENEVLEFLLNVKKLFKQEALYWVKIGEGYII